MLIRTVILVACAAAQFVGGFAAGAYFVNKQHPNAQMCYRVWRSSAELTRGHAYPPCMDQPIPRSDV